MKFMYFDTFNVVPIGFKLHEDSLSWFGQMQW